MPRSSSKAEQCADAVTVESGGAAGDAESVVLEPKLDPEMEKYMTIVRQQREKEKLEKQVGLAAELISRWICSMLFVISVFYTHFLVKTISLQCVEITLK